jgi:hypothetical protein
VAASTSSGIHASLLLAGLTAAIAFGSPQRADAVDHTAGLRLQPHWSAEAGFSDPRLSSGGADRELVESISIPSSGPGPLPPVGYTLEPKRIGARARPPGVLRLNVKGFSLFEMRKGGGSEFRVRRIREREMRRPIVSLQFKKRF